MLGGVELGAGTVAVKADNAVDLTIKLTADSPAAP